MPPEVRREYTVRSVTAFLSDLLEYYGGPAADVYFQRAEATLAGAGLDPVVGMDYFCDRAGVLCGVKDAVGVLQQVLRGTDELWALDDGDTMAAQEVVLRVRAPYSHFGRYETALLGMMASCSGWATAAREVVEAAAGKRVISFGARHVHPLVGPVMEYSAVVGGCAGCATPLGAELAGLKAPSGTMPHAMILIFGDTVEAALAFDHEMPEDVLRIVLVDTFKDEAEESLRVAEAMGERLRGVRLDTPRERGGVTVALAKEVRARLDQAGHPRVGIFVSGGMTAERIRQFIEAGVPVDSFGVGMAISSAAPIGFTADIKEVAGEPRTKRGRVPGLTHNPRLKRVR
jgi:nicotinate phosphoribosyltransferase